MMAKSLISEIDIESGLVDENYFAISGRRIGSPAGQFPPQQWPAKRRLDVTRLM